MWRKPRSSEWLLRSDVLNTIGFESPKNCGSLRAIKPKVFNGHRNRSLSGRCLWARAHQSIKEQQMWATKPHPHQDRRYAFSFIVSASHTNSCKQVPYRSGISDKRVYSSIKRSHAVRSRYLPCTCYVSAKRNNLPVSQDTSKQSVSDPIPFSVQLCCGKLG